MPKPENCARRKDFTFDAGYQYEALTLVARYHYAKSASNTSVVRTIMRRENEAVGAALWMPAPAGAVKELVRRYLPPEQERQQVVLMLSRLVLTPGLPTNSASLLLGASTKQVWRDPRWKILVTYADTSLGHTGGIYRATGWVEDGITLNNEKWEREGKLVCRTQRKSVRQLQEEGATRSRSKKIRFIKLRQDL
jgi:hypothetical protein